MSTQSTRVTDSDMPRGMEVLEAYVARRGSITLDEERIKLLIGRAASMILSGGQVFSDRSLDPWTRQIGEYTACMGASVLSVLGVSKDEAKALLRQMHTDLTSFDPEAGA